MALLERNSTLTDACESTLPSMERPHLGFIRKPFASPRLAGGLPSMSESEKIITSLENLTQRAVSSEYLEGNKSPFLA